MTPLFSRLKNTDMKDLWTYLKETEKPIVLYGTGNGADKIYARLSKDGIKISGVFASYGFKKGKEFFGFTVTSYEDLKSKLGDMIVLCCFGSHLENVINDILEIGKTSELYLPDVPVYGQEVFDIAFAKKHKDELTEVYDMLSDSQSKKVFENVIYYKLTGRAEYLTSCETHYDETAGILNPQNESFLDLGAYNGDTVLQFIFYDKNYKSITALEPDGRNFEKLKKNTENLRDIALINGAVDSFDGVIEMSKNKGRGNSSTEKTVLTNAYTVDAVAKENLPTFIKMDVEGNELSAIKGAINTIKHKPKMQIAAYHRSEDLFSIPLEILKINPEYKIYMRKQRALPAWDINYIFI